MQRHRGDGHGALLCGERQGAQRQAGLHLSAAALQEAREAGAHGAPGDARALDGRLEGLLGDGEHQALLQRAARGRADAEEAEGLDLTEHASGPQLPDLGASLGLQLDAALEDNQHGVRLLARAGNDLARLVGVGDWQLRRHGEEEVLWAAKEEGRLAELLGNGLHGLGGLVGLGALGGGLGGLVRLSDRRSGGLRGLGRPRARGRPRPRRPPERRSLRRTRPPRPPPRAPRPTRPPRP
mmetsp:Transcript_61071/g.170443  ORF Transcript_61071/g.170443 Transcript_61071/m.170443 type:complete len:239 (+) Transcript_61071:1191-1907(+)